MSHRCEHCRKTFRTAHGAKVHGNTCRFNINQYPTSKKNSIKSSTPAPRRSSRERKPVTSAGPAASEKKSGKSTVNSATRQVAQKDLERHLRALVGTIFFKDFPKSDCFEKCPFQNSHGHSCETTTLYMKWFYVRTKIIFPGSPKNLFPHPSHRKPAKPRVQKIFPRSGQTRVVLTGSDPIQ